MTYTRQWHRPRADSSAGKSPGHFLRDRGEQFPAQNALYNSGEAGIGVDAAKWLAAQKVIAVGADNWAVEVIPFERPELVFVKAHTSPR